MFDAYISIPAHLLPASYVRHLNAQDPEELPYGPNDPVDDLEVSVDHNPGWYQPGNRSGHPDNWTPDEGEDPEILKVEIADPDWTPAEGETRDLDGVLTPALYREIVSAANEADRQTAEDYY